MLVTNLSRGAEVFCGTETEVEGQQHLTEESVGTVDWLDSIYSGIT